MVATPSPGLTVVGTLGMSVAIGIVAAFHAITGVFLDPRLPVPDGARVVAIWNVDTETASRGRQTLGDMLAWQRELASVDDLGAFTIQQRVVFAADGRARSVRAAEISASAFRMLRVPPLLGRPLVATDARLGESTVALLSFDLWHSAFAADSTIVGQTIRLGSEQHTVVGVMPPGFRFPFREQLWTPMPRRAFDLGPGEGPAIGFTIGRLAPGISLATAAAELDVVGSRLAADHPETHGPLRPQITSYARSFINADAPGAARAMDLARVLIVIVLVIAGVNVGALVYARSAARATEVAIRTALGATRGRIVLHLFVEALVLASLAAAIGTGLVVWSLNQMETLLNSPGLLEDLPYWFDARLTPSTVLLIVALTLMAALLTGILPALKVTRRPRPSKLRQGSGSAASLNFGKSASAVIVLQVATSITLLIVAVTQLRTFVEDQALEEDGIPRDEYLTAELRVDREPSLTDAVEGQAGDWARSGVVWRELGRRLSKEPALRGVTFATSLPGTAHPTGIVEVEGRPLGSEDVVERVWFASVAPSYFDVFGVPVRAGRGFDAGDVVDPEVGAAIVNEAFVARALGSAEPIGRRVRIARAGAATPWVEIVGVVQNQTEITLGAGPSVLPTIYFPLVTSVDAPIHVAVHVRGDPLLFIGRLRAIGSEVDGALVLHQPKTLEESLGRVTTSIRLFSVGITLLTLAALLLSTAGVQALMAFTVSQRTREIGIRTARGAEPWMVVRDIFSKAAVQLGAGTTLGLVLGFIAVRGAVLDHGPGVIVGIAGVIFTMGLMSCTKPISKALRIQPTEAISLNP